MKGDKKVTEFVPARVMKIDVENGIRTMTVQLNPGSDLDEIFEVEDSGINDTPEPSIIIVDAMNVIGEHGHYLTSYAIAQAKINSAEWFPGARVERDISKKKKYSSRLSELTKDHLDDFRERHISALAASQRNIQSHKSFVRSAARNILYPLYLEEVGALNSKDSNPDKVIVPIGKTLFNIYLGGKFTVDRSAETSVCADCAEGTQSFNALRSWVKSMEGLSTTLFNSVNPCKRIDVQGKSKKSEQNWANMMIQEINSVENYIEAGLTKHCDDQTDLACCFTCRNFALGTIHDKCSHERASPPTQVFIGPRKNVQGIPKTCAGEGCKKSIIGTFIPCETCEKVNNNQ